MGLNTSHNAFDGSYSTFSFLRVELANHLGIKLHKMEGFGGVKRWSTVDDDAKILLHHSDCDGDISPEDCKLLSLRLLEILKDLPISEEWPSLYQFVKKFATGAALAAKKNEKLIFG